MAMLQQQLRFWWWEDFSGAQFSLKYFWISVIFFVTVFVSVINLGPQHDARFGIIDDHVLVRLLGEQLNWSDLPSRLVHDTEVGQFGFSKRYRPVYVTLRLVETTAFGNNPSYYYALRLVLFIVLILTTWLIAATFLGIFLGGMLTAYVLSLPMWPDIWARLGPAEQYGALGTCFLIFGCSVWLSNWKSKRRLDLAAALIGVGCFVAIGSKENFLIFTPIPAFALVSGIYYRRIGIPAAFALTSSLAIAALVLADIGLALHRDFTDSYGNSPTFSLLKTSFVGKLGIVIALGCLVVSIIYARLISARDRVVQINYLSLVARCAFATFSMSALFLSQYVFYSGQWSKASRFAFPGRLVEPAFYILLFYFACELSNIITFPWFNRKTIGGALFGLLMTLTLISGWKLPSATADNAARTKLFEEAVSDTTEILAMWPGRPVVVESYNPWDLEPIVSILTYLKAHQILNPIFLQTHYFPSDDEKKNFDYKVLGAIVEHESIEGNKALNLLPLLDLTATPGLPLVIDLKKPDLETSFASKSSLGSPDALPAVLPLSAYVSAPGLVVCYFRRCLYGVYG
jgi:hypothetical protein